MFKLNTSMRISELNAPNATRKWLNDVAWKRHLIQGENPEYLDKLKQQGFTLAGPTGASGAVFRKDGYPFVLKIFGFDDAYMSWYNYCKANQANPYLPKIKGGIVKLEKHIFGVRLEYLEFKSEEIQKTVTDEVEDLIRSNVTRIDPITYEYIPDDPQLYEVIAAINKFRKKYTLDLNSGNIMWRGHQFVIIDPLV